MGGGGGGGGRGGGGVGGGGCCDSDGDGGERVWWYMLIIKRQKTTGHMKNKSCLIYILKTMHRVYCYSLKNSIGLKYLQILSSYLTENELHCCYND